MKKSSLVALALVVSVTAFSQDTTYYSFVSKGKVAGEQRIWQPAPGEYHYTFHYNDRGRGDSVLSAVRVDSGGNIVALKTEGVDYYKNPYAESFALQADSAVWSVNGARKTKRFDGQLYNAGDIAPGEMELLVRQLEKQKDRKIKILPDGAVHCDEPRSITLSINGQPSNLKLYTLYFDPDPSPTQVWLTEDLHFFALANLWFTVVPKGDETWGDSLISIQETASQPYYETQ